MLAHQFGARLAFGRVEIDHRHLSAAPGEVERTAAADAARQWTRATLPVNSTRHDLVSAWSDAAPTCALAQKFMDSLAHRHAELRGRSQGHGRRGWIIYCDRGRRETMKKEPSLVDPDSHMTALPSGI